MGEFVTEVARGKEFQERLQALCAEFADVVGPTVDQVTGRICDHEQGEDCPCGTADAVMMTEWILLSSWVDMDDPDRSYSSARYAEHMLKSHKLGLLYMFAKDM